MYLKSVRGWSAVPFYIIYHNLKSKSHLILGLCAIINHLEVIGKVETMLLPIPYLAGHR